MSHPRDRLDDLVHQPLRFSLLAALTNAEELEFRFVREVLDTSDSVLSKQVSRLEEAGYVKARKGYVGKRPRTWLSITRSGRKAFENHLATLQTIAAGH